MPSIQVKVVGDFCNLRCTYCRDRDFNQDNKRVMSYEVLQALIDSLACLPQQFQRMHWLGGEPTLAGLDFFQEVVKSQRPKSHKKWLNTIQTNATLIDRGWAEFLKASDFKVGVSIDGTVQTHDVNRINMAGHGSYTKAMAGVHILREAGINPSVICVVTKRNVQLGAQMLRNLVESGFTNIAFNAFYNTATEPSCDSLAVSDESWTKFLKDIFEEWILLDRPDIQVREIDDMLAWTQGKVTKSCVFRGTCSSWMVVDFDGRVYPCERLGRSVCFGDVNSVISFAELLKNSAYQAFTTQTKRIPDRCQICSLQNFCHNGCVANRIEDGNSLPHYAYCGSRLMFHKYLSKRIGAMGDVVAPKASAPGIPGIQTTSTF